MRLKTTILQILNFFNSGKGEELFSFIRDASFVLVPSEWYENNPLTIVEAYSSGKPVIGSNIGGIPELIIEEKTGYLFSMGDSMELEAKINKAMKLTESEYLEMSETAYRFACDKFSEKAHYRDLLNIYREVIKIEHS